MGSATTPAARLPRREQGRRAGDAEQSGRPRQSLVYYRRDGDRLLISTLADRLKTRDIERNGWASLCVMGHEPPTPPPRSRDPRRS